MQLDHEQQVALDAMLAGQNVFLTGRAGTGKSAVINEFIRHHPANLVCVAPTGLAARNLTKLEQSIELLAYHPVCYSQVIWLTSYWKKGHF